MEITKVEASAHAVPIDVPFGEGPDQWNTTFVTIQTNDGIVGYGETGVFPPTATASYINEHIAPLLIGNNPLETEDIHTLLHSKLNSRTHTGIWSAAVSAVDVALWDIKGKYVDEPLWRVLGGGNGEVDVYVTLGAPVDDEELAMSVETVFDKWSERVKVVVGRNEQSTPTSDAARLNTIFSRVENRGNIAIDANCEYTFDEALDLCNRLRGKHIAWFEEPVVGNNVSLLADLRSRSTIPISAGQFSGNRYVQRDFIEHGAIDICQPNVCYVGGYTEALKVAGTAESFDLPLIHGGGWPFQNAHLFAGLPNGRLLELHTIIWEVGKVLYDFIPEPNDGTLTLSDDPGLGLEPNRKALEQTRIGEE